MWSTCFFSSSSPSKFVGLLYKGRRICIMTENWMKNACMGIKRRSLSSRNLQYWWTEAFHSTPSPVSTAHNIAQWNGQQGNVTPVDLKVLLPDREIVTVTVRKNSTADEVYHTVVERINISNNAAKYFYLFEIVEYNFGK